MAKGKTRTRRLVKGRRARLCIQNDAVHVRLNRKTLTKDPQPDIQIYPNYPVLKGRIVKEDMLPQNLEVNCGGFSLKFEAATVEVNDETFEKLEHLSKSVVQLHFVQIAPIRENKGDRMETLTKDSHPKTKKIKYGPNSLKKNSLPKHEEQEGEELGETEVEEDKEEKKEYEPNMPSIYSGTGVLVKFQEKEFIFSCLHTFMPSSRIFDHSEIIITYDDEDLSDEIEKHRDKFWSKNKGMSFLNYSKEYSKNKTNFWEAYLDRGFVQFRKEWLQKIDSSQDYTSILDPVSNMKPSPAFDFSVLNLSESTAQSLRNGGAQFVELEDFAKCEAKPGEKVFLFGYNDTRYEVDFLTDEYQKTLIVDFGDEKEGAQENTNKELIKSVTARLTKFLNPGKSLSMGKCDKFEQGFLLYKASTSEGSNGGPVFNSSGQLVGISFGNFQDIESAYMQKALPWDECYDIKVPSEVLVDESRNYNLAIALNHPAIISYFETRNKNLMVNRFSMSE